VKLIGLCGHPGAGKTTVAQHLWRQHHFISASFAAPLKTVACQVYGLTAAQVDGTQEQKLEPTHVIGPDGNPRSGREILQLLGTEGFRNVSPTTWVDLGRRTVRQCARDGKDVAFHDVRFENEIDMIREEGGSIWEIRRSDIAAAEDGHASSNDWLRAFEDLPPDVRLVANPGDVKGLCLAVDAALALDARGRFKDGEPATVVAPGAGV